MGALQLCLVVSIAGFSIAEFYVISLESIARLTTMLTGGFEAQRICRSVQRLVRHLILSLYCPDGCSPLFYRFCFLFPATFSIEHRHILKGHSHLRVIGTESLLPDRKRALIERLSLCILALGIVQQREVVQVRRHRGMTGSRFLGEPQRN